MFNFPKNEEEVLSFWREKDIFKKTVEGRPAERQFIFFDGPPFATGLPHYGHLVAGTIKDAIPRYWTMKGCRVERRFGWDCHGLPVEYEVEKELGISGKKDIEEKFGIAKFNAACRGIVSRYVGEWRKTVERTGRWVDMANAYRTMDMDYMESIWWVFKSLHDKGLIYEGFKILPYCPRCATPLSNFEANMPGSYKEVVDPSVTIRFKAVGQDNTYFLVWTTTPWTLPANSGLAVGPNFVYVKIRDKADHRVYILARERLHVYYPEPGQYEILTESRGEDLVGLIYEPLFPYFADKQKEGAFRVVAADFVSLAEGTGVVHLAPAFGEEDYQLGQKERLPLINPVDASGCFDQSVTDYAGFFIKKADKKIIDDLEKAGKLFREETLAHSYPHCWRCESPLIYKAVASWFVAVTKIKDQLLENNRKIYWLPEHLKEGRFGNWLAEARDWAVSRNRYWGTPLPVWRCEQCQKTRVIDSLEELKDILSKKNRFFLVRHGLADHNVRNLIDSRPDHSYLTAEGREAVESLAEKLKSEGVTKIITSPITRTRQTAEILARVLGAPVEEDERLWEIRWGVFDGKIADEYHQFFQNFAERWTKRPEGGETLVDVTRRMREALQDFNARYQGETIAIISHGDPLWLLEAALQKKDKPETLEEVPYLEPASFHEIKAVEMDLHRPQIDKIELPCVCGGQMRRVSEVLDCWFESGVMPYAQAHYPFENKKEFEKNFPAHFIAEGIDQTRGWFYTLLVISTALFDQPAFLNVVVNGLILTEDGKKMSKRLKNYPEPEEIINKYGADALRLYLLSSPVARGETLCFSEKGAREILQKTLMLFWNVFIFWQTYGAGKISFSEPRAEHLLDRWILTKLNALINGVTGHLEKYDLMKVSRQLMEFINEFSTWYVRRSRARFKNEAAEADKAAEILGYALLTLTKLMAPLTPFIAETIYQKLGGVKESVHLEDWPRAGQISEEKVLSQMALARELVTALLEERAKADLPIRQVLAAAEIRGYALEAEYLAIIQDEVNVKEIKLETKGERAVKLDITLTPELKREGLSREFIRHLNFLRKEKGLTLENRVDFYYQTNSEILKQVLEEYGKEIAKGSLVKKIISRKMVVDLEKILELGGEKIWLGIKLAD